MNIVITGHTRGIGKELAGIFSKFGHAITGYSKSTGHDISLQSVRDEIVEASAEADVFINNAYDSVGQTELLKSMIAKWEGTTKTIINLSSKLVFFPGDTSLFKEYIDQKKLQNEIVASRHTIALPRLINVLPGIVDTEMSHAVFDSPRMSPRDLADLIYYLYTKPRLRIQEVIVDVPELDWSAIKIKDQNV
jgi:hypothetical protein